MEEQAVQAIRVETTIQQDSSLLIERLPIHAGAEIEVILLVKSASTAQQAPHSLRNVPITYTQPTEPAAQDAWEAGR
jgi:hypothetical protein